MSSWTKDRDSSSGKEVVSEHLESLTDTNRASSQRSSQIRNRLTTSVDAVSECLSTTTNIEVVHTIDNQETVTVDAFNVETGSSVRITYSNAKAIGSGSFGVVFNAILDDDREVAIKKVLQDKRYKMYSFQLLRGLAYIHHMGVCHRDIKPQNLLINPEQGVLKICDFGSAKILNPNEPNVSYICSRYYRAPELIFGATQYTVQIDMWSAGCVIGELLLGRPLFPGESSVDQLVEIIRVLGTPTHDQVRQMNPHYSEFKFPIIAGCPWEKLIRHRNAESAFVLLQDLLVYSPNERATASQILGCSFFSDLISPPPGHPADAKGHLPSGKPGPHFLNEFTEEELSYLPKEMVSKIRACRSLTRDRNTTLEKESQTSNRPARSRIRTSTDMTRDTTLTGPRNSIPSTSGLRKTPRPISNSMYLGRSDTTRTNGTSSHDVHMMTTSVTDVRPSASFGVRRLSNDVVPELDEFNYQESTNHESIDQSKDQSITKISSVSNRLPTTSSRERAPSKVSLHNARGSHSNHPSKPAKS